MFFRSTWKILGYRDMLSSISLWRTMQFSMFHHKIYLANAYVPLNILISVSVCASKHLREHNQAGIWLHTWLHPNGNCDLVHQKYHRGARWSLQKLQFFRTESTIPFSVPHLWMKNGHYSPSHLRNIIPILLHGFLWVWYLCREGQRWNRGFGAVHRLTPTLCPARLSWYRHKFHLLSSTDGGYQAGLSLFFPSSFWPLRINCPSQKDSSQKDSSPETLSSRTEPK